MLNIIYQDQHLLIINKPSCIHSVKNSLKANVSLADALIKWDPSQEECSPNASDAGLVQRLDYETSGLIIAARKLDIWEKLHKQILAGEIKKTYIALVHGQVPKSIEISNYIGTPYRRAKKMCVYQKPTKKDRALEAASKFQRLWFSKDRECSLVKVTAPTARRHQVRAHASYIGHALIGDKLYGSIQNLGSFLARPDNEDYPSFYLQANYLSFVHPITRKKLTFNLPLEVEIAALEK